MTEAGQEQGSIIAMGRRLSGPFRALTDACHLSR